MEMTEGERKWYKTGVQIGIEAFLNKRWDFIEAYTEKGVVEKELGITCGKLYNPTIDKN